MKGWRRVAPGRSRRPLPRPVVAAIAARLIARGQKAMAAWTMIGFGAYLRPSGNMSLQKVDLIKPEPGMSAFWALLIYPEEREDKSKTGLKGTALLWDVKEPD